VRKAVTGASFDGVGGTLRTDIVGDFREFGTVYFSPRAPVNIPEPHPLYLISVDDNKQKFQKREVLGAEQARDLLRKLGYPSERDMVKMISSGGILNSPVTTRDVRVARAIFGPDLATLKGKTTRE